MLKYQRNNTRPNHRISFLGGALVKNPPANTRPNHRMSFPGGTVVKNTPANAGDAGLIPSSGKIPWRRKWQLTPAFLPGNPTDRGAWQATVHGVATELDTT